VTISAERLKNHALLRDVGKLTDSDRQTAKNFLKMLAQRSEAKRK
jgi:hypothetical protein